MRLALDKSKEISTSNCKNQKKLQLYKLKIASKMFCNLFVPHLIGIPITLSRRPIFWNRPITYVEIDSLLICLVSSNRCTCSSPLDIDLTLLRSRHPRARKALNIWHYELLLDLCSLFATCRNHKWEIKWSHDIMFKQYTSNFLGFFSPILKLQYSPMFWEVNVIRRRMM